MIELALNNIQKSFGAEKVLQGVSFEIQNGEKIGLIGRNGCGKTTIFRIISGDEIYDSGIVSQRKDLTIGFLQQVPVIAENLSSKDILKSAFRDILKLEDELKELEEKLNRKTGSVQEKLIRKYGDLQSIYESSGGYEIDMNLGRICSGLKISGTMLQQNFNDLSGGEKTRIQLGKILLEKTELLLLDEPTNHLDIDSIEWLENFLQEYDGAAIIVSHDRYFLDKIVSRIVDIEMGQAVNYHGNYSDFIQEKDRRILAEFENFKNVQKKIKAMKAAAERYRIWGRINTDNSAHMARAKRLEARIEELREVTRPKIGRSINLSFSRGKRSGKNVLRITGLKKSFNALKIFEDLDFHLVYGERVALLGKNGAGKTTFFKVLLKELNPDKGEVRIGSQVNIGYLEQEVSFRDQSLSLLELLIKEFPMSEGEARNKLAGFLFYRDDVFKKVKDISGGEKVRLRLCLLMQRSLNLLLLDEPTNHLDIESKEMVEKALLDFEGTILFISHDRYFINKITDRIVELDNLKFRNYPGDYTYFLEQKIKGSSHTKKHPGEKTKNIGGSNRNIRVKGEKVILRRLVEIEDEISWLEKEIDNREEEMKKYPLDYLKLSEIHQEKTDLKVKMDRLYEEWGQLNE